MKTASERLFETYLRSHGVNEFDYEPEIVGFTRHPEYRMRLAESELFFGVKEFEPPQEIRAGGSFDPYPPIRSKINEAQKQLRALKGQMCGIVLANPHDSFVFLEPMVIFGAMRSVTSESRCHSTLPRSSRVKKDLTFPTGLTAHFAVMEARRLTRKASVFQKAFGDT